MSLKILHIIETLGIGGAELLFAHYISELEGDVENYVVYLRGPNTLLPELRNVKEATCLNHKNKWAILKSATKLRGLVKRWEIDIVHAHLYWPTIVARLALHDGVKLVYSLHNLISYDAFAPNKLSLHLERLTYSQKYYTISVSQAVQQDYAKYIKLGGHSSVLHNFVAGAFFEEENAKRSFNNTVLKLVSVGNLRKQKNYSQLIIAMAQLKEYDVSLDIVGEGPEREQLWQLIVQHQLEGRVRLTGSETSVASLLGNYDIFVSSTRYEGFYIAMAEAMAVGLPCIVPDAEVLREVSGNTQVYYSHTSELVEAIKKFYHNRQYLSNYSEEARKAATSYTLERYIAELMHIYKSVKQK